MSNEQAAELERIYPGAQATMVSETLPSNPREAVARFDEIAADADVVEAVLPVNLLEAVLKFSNFSKRGGAVIRAITQRNLRDDDSVTFDFQHYERVLKIEVVTERL
jgi:hypothetical protein